MPNIPGIIGFAEPGAYSLLETRSGPVSLPGAPTVVAILGKGQREEFVVQRAVGGGQDGLPKDFDPANAPDGRHFQVNFYPVAPGKIEVYLNPVGDGTDLPLIRIKQQGEADSWEQEFDDVDGYSGFAGLNGPGGDSVDGVNTPSDGAGFFDSKWGRRYQQLKERMGIGAGAPEPNHYILNEDTGQFILDQALQPFDTLLVVYVAIPDLNSPELFTDISDIFVKHGFPSKDNTIALAAQMAAENGAGTFMPIHAGEVIRGEGSATRVVSEPTLFTALEALEREELVSILVPVMTSRVYNETIMPLYDVQFANLTGDGAFLQEDPATGDQPGINISPLAVTPLGQPGAGNPVFLEVYLNGRELQYGIDYSVPNLDGSAMNGSTNVLIALDPNYNGATHSIDNTLVPGDKVVASYLPDNSVIDLVATSQLACISHCQIMSETQNRQERTALIGSYEFADLDYILDPVTGIDANYGTTKRAVYFWPGGPSIRRVVAGEIQTLDGQFIAASAAGFVASRPLPTSLTNKTLTGFSIDPAQKLNIDETNLAGGANVAIVKPLGAGGKVVIGQTTTNSGQPTEEEYSVVRIGDHVSKTTRVALENAFTGELITVNTPDDVKAATASILDAFVSQGILTSYENLKTSVDKNDPRQINVQFDVTPIFPLNYIFIRFTVGV